QAREQPMVVAHRAGVVQRVEPRVIGRGIIALGGGRTTMEDDVDPSVGFRILVKPGDRIMRGQPLAGIYARDAAGVAIGEACVKEAIVIGDEDVTPLPAVSHRITARGVETL
ncbi:MAG: thymidine phosphorylase, partial [Gemmatimonadetes bacterium]|nr:thymidine phosphorylase [Gemmatimonadota bacterium]